MPVPDFLDSNVLVYAYDASAPEKRGVAQDLVRRAVRGELIISTQVLAEFAAILLHEVAPPMDPVELMDLLEALSPIKTIKADEDLVRRAIEAHAKYGIHFWDGMIVAAAERGRCERIWSEDLNAGQEYFGVVVENPFG